MFAINRERLFHSKQIVPPMMASDNYWRLERMWFYIMVTRRFTLIVSIMTALMITHTSLKAEG